MSRPDLNPEFLDTLEKAVMDRQGTRINGGEIRHSCSNPEHPDEHPSAVYNAKDGVFWCPVCDAKGGAFDLADLIGVERPEQGANDTPSRKRVVHSYMPNLTVAQLAEAKGIDESFLRNCGVSDITRGGGSAVRIIYHDPDGGEGATRYRLCLEKGNPDNRFQWKAGSKARLYGLNRLSTIEAAGYTWLEEGETDSWTLWQAKEPALGLPGASQWKDERDAQHVDKAETVYAIVEPDAGGETFRKKLAASSIRDKVRLVDLSPWGAKDANELYLADRERFAERLAEAREAAVSLADLQTQADEETARTAYESAYEYLYDSNILARIRTAMRARGYAGSLAPSMMAYVAITSTSLDAPLNMAFIAPSGAGKNRAVDEGRAFAPDDVVYEIKAGSATAVIYNDASFENKAVLFSEADSIPEEGAAASAIRNIASDNEMSYEVTIRDESTGKFVVHRIVKPGPTSLLTTSTRSLRHQLNTRVLEVPIPDDANQTRAVMHAHAASVMPSAGTDIDLAPFIALQTWLRIKGERRIAVPFAQALADLLPAGAVRMRRDFRQLLTFIQSIAFLHQLTRERTPEGWVIASIDDYREARNLLAQIFDVSTSEGVTPAIREVVDAIEEREEVSLAELAKRLKLAKTTVNWRTQRAIRGGWLVNNETRKGQPARFARGTPLPEEKSVMPTPEELSAAYECTSDFGEELDRTPSPAPDAPPNVDGEAPYAIQQRVAAVERKDREGPMCIDCGALLEPPNTYYCPKHGGVPASHNGQAVSDVMPMMGSV